MSLALLLPAGLAALAALLVPLLLHLARRSEQRVTDFAALRWLAAAPRPRRKRRFDERLLLAVRLLLLAALALLLAQPVLYGRADRTRWIVAAPGVPVASARAAAGDAPARLHWLASGFPAMDAPPPREPQPLASLLRELDASLPAGTPLTVLVPPLLDGADAQRPRLSRAVDWRIVVDAAPPQARTPARAPRFTLDVRAAPDTDALRYVRATGAAWWAQARGRDGTAAAHASPVRIADPAQPLPADARHLAWLAPGPLPDAVRDWVAGGGSALLAANTVAPELANADVLWADAGGAPLVRGVALGRGRLLRFTRPLAPATMPQLLEVDFPQRLRALFEPAPPAPARVDARDYAPTTGAAPFPQPPQPLAPWLLIAIALLFLLERWLASAPRREAAA
ncbi:MAG TPA: BatA domain-containing protein [Xanthomonadaceae bacterium]|nr:BatA domain-containing protein [Xanthomonadaceae bacterium]